jgi:predicted small secreted protein
MKADRISWLGLIGIVLIFGSAVALGGCGNTIQGIGTDIVETGKKVSDWQNKPEKSK